MVEADESCRRMRRVRSVDRMHSPARVLPGPTVARDPPETACTLHLLACNGECAFRRRRTRFATGLRCLVLHGSSMHLLACCNGEYARDTTLATALQQQSCETMLSGFSWPPSPLPLPEGGMSQSLPIGGDDSFGNLNGRPYEQHVRSPHIPTRTSLRH